MNRNRRKNNNHGPHGLHGQRIKAEKSESVVSVWCCLRQLVVNLVLLLGIAAVSLGGCDLQEEEAAAAAEKSPPFRIHWDHCGIRADNGFSVDSSTNTAAGEAYAVNIDGGPPVFVIADPFTAYVVHDLPPGLTVTAQCTNGYEVKFTLSGTANPPLASNGANQGPKIHYMTIELKNAGFVRGRPTDDERVLSAPKIEIRVGTPITGTVSIAGTPRLGQTLTANTGALGGSGIVNHNWLRDGNIIWDPKQITASTYVLDANDVGHEISVRVNRQFNIRPITSAAVTVAP